MTNARFLSFTTGDLDVVVSYLRSDLKTGGRCLVYLHPTYGLTVVDSAWGYIEHDDYYITVEDRDAFLYTHTFRAVEHVGSLHEAATFDTRDAAIEWVYSRLFDFVEDP